MSIDHSTLTKGQVRKLNALRKSVGDDIADEAFTKVDENPVQDPQRKFVTLSETHWLPHSQTSKTTRVSSWEIRVMS